jgi:hypothetical protein
MIYTDLISMLRDMKKHYKSLRNPQLLSDDDINKSTIGFVISGKDGYIFSKNFKIKILFGPQTINLIPKYVANEIDPIKIEKEIYDLFSMSKNYLGARNVYEFIVHNKTENYPQLNLIISRLEKLEVFE